MAQLTGTQIAALARLKAQDQQGSVVDADLLTILNHILLWWQDDIEPARVTTLSAASSGCTFGAGVSTVVLTDTTIEDIQTFHPSAGTSVVYPLYAAIDRVDPEEIWARYNQVQGGGTTVQVGNQWVMWAAERDTENSDAWAVHTYPAVAGSATLRCTRRAILSTLSGTPDISYRAANIIACLLGYELARLQKQNDADWLNGILFGVPKNVLDNWKGQARMAAATQGFIRDSGAISR